MKDETANSPNTASRSASDRPYKLLAASLLIAVSVYFAINSYSQPGSILHGARIWARPYMPHQSDPNMSLQNDDDTCDLHDPNEEPLPAVRTEFGAAGTIVYGWPSTGGVWVHEDCYGVELNFLGLDRFEPSETQRYSPEEDAFCNRLEKIGGRFFASELEYNRQSFRDRKARVWIGWPAGKPEGGLWVLKTELSEASEMGVSRIRNALTMAERCKAIEKLGGKYYESWEDYAAANSGNQTS